MGCILRNFPLYERIEWVDYTSDAQDVPVVPVDVCIVSGTKDYLQGDVAVS